MCLNINSPADKERALRAAWGSDPERRVLEAALVEAYRQGKVSSGYVGDVLGIGVMGALELITSRGVAFPLDHGDVGNEVEIAREWLKRHRDPSA
jgi:predicted HTH domain antitoxin